MHLIHLILMEIELEIIDRQTSVDDKSDVSSGTCLMGWVAHCLNGHFMSQVFPIFHCSSFTLASLS